MKMKPAPYGLKHGLALDKGVAGMRNAKAFLAIGLALVFGWSCMQCRLGSGREVLAQSRTDLAAINVDYPEDGSIFPPEITAPTFIWHDAIEGRRSVDDRCGVQRRLAGIRFQSQGVRLRIGEIDPRACFRRAMNCPS